MVKASTCLLVKLKCFPLPEIHTDVLPSKLALLILRMSELKYDKKSKQIFSYKI